MSFDRWLFLLFLWQVSVVAAATSSNISAVSIPPSLYWNGDNGQWSTFQIQVGTPGQTVQLMPGTSATSATSIWVVISEGCTDVNPTLVNCANERGYLFQSNASTSWSTQGLANTADGAIYSLTLFEESKLGIAGNASFGYDTVTLGIPGSGLPTLEDQLIAGIWTDEFFLGSLGLSPIPTNFSNLNDPQTSLLSSMRNQSLLPSLSWGYTAGAYYRTVFGSLTLGGYDTTRFQSDNVTVGFGPDFSRDLVVGLKSITYDTAGSTPLLAQSIDIFIDSLVTDLWLPVDVCNSFAERFNLTWNEQGQLYLVSESAHAALSRQNPSFTFTIGQPSTGTNDSETVDIVFPYSAFDLNLTAPIVSNGTTARYFPLKQAQNSTQYTLGRTFLQEAYVVADYDRRNFSVSQALFPSTSTEQNIVSIRAPGEDGDSSGDQSSGGGLSSGAIGGIVVGVVAGIAIILAIVWIPLRRKRQRAAATRLDPTLDEKKDATEVAAEDQQGIHEAEDAEARRHEMDVPYKKPDGYFKNAHEVDSSPAGHELESPGILGAYEMSGHGVSRAHELAGPGINAQEMAVHEFPAHELEAPLR